MPAASEKQRYKVADELKRAVHFHRCGQLNEAERIYNQILTVMPLCADAWHLLGVIWRERGKFQNATQIITKAIQLDGSVPLYYVSLGDVYQAQEDYAEAVAVYRRALRLNPKMIEALCNMGNALREQGNLQQAIACYEKCLTINPHRSEVFNNLGLAHYKFQNYPAAVDSFKKSVELNPADAEAYNNLGNIYRDQSNFEAAIACYRQAHAITPENPLINYNLGVVYQIMHDSKEAFKFYQKAVQYEPSFASAHSNLAKLYQDLNCFDDALDHYKKALQIEPDHADARFNRSLALLATSKFKEGWQEYEWRFKRGKWKKIYPHRLVGRRWDGSDFSGKRLFIHSEQGFGDTIQFIRYLPLVKSFGGFIIFEVREELYELLRDFQGFDQLSIMSFDHPPQEEYDFYIPLMSLPGLFETTLENIPGSMPYISAPGDKHAYWLNIINGSKPKIGLVWAAKPTYDHQKSCPLEHYFPLFQFSQLKFYGLQKGNPASLPKELPANMVNLGNEFGTFADTAGAIACLDLVISVDTAVAHLAGAMGKPVWLILPYAPDWRWLMDRTDTPWYPTMRIFRQPSPGDWEGAINMLKRSLQYWIKTNRL